jgi:hypothetical protein
VRGRRSYGSVTARIKGIGPTVYGQTETSEDLQYSGTPPSVSTVEWTS